MLLASRNHALANIHGRFPIAGGGAMSHYKSNLRDIKFNLFEVLQRQDVLGAAPYPDMDADTIDYGIARMKEYGIVDSGDTLKDGIGAMNDARVASFFEKMVRAGVLKPYPTKFRAA